MKPKLTTASAALRRAAEARLNERTTPRPLQTEADLRRIQHELEVHQIELEIQNEELSAAMERYTDHFDFAPVGYFNFTPDGTIQLLNLTGATFLGIERGRLVGRGFETFLSRDSLESVRAVGTSGSGSRRAFDDFLRRVFESAARQTCELALGAQGRPSLTVRLDGTLSPDGKECRAVMIDVTAHKKTEAARDLLLSLTQATLESTADGLLVVNREGMIETFNQAFAQMWRVPDDLLAAKDDARVLQFVIHQLSEPHKFLDKISYLYSHPEKESFDSLEFKDGRVFERYSRPQLLHGDGVGRVWSFRDITERKRAEEVLRDSETRFRAIFEQAAVGVALVAPDGRWLSVNDRFCNMIGYAREELTSLTFQHITHPDDLEADLEFVRQLLAGERLSYTKKKRYLSKAGAVIWINLTRSLVRDPSGAPSYFISVVQDLDVQKRAEQSLEQSHLQLRALLARLRQAQEAERLRISHEIHDELGQLLTGLKMDVYWLEQKLSTPDLPAAFNPLLDRAVAASELADTMLDYVQKIAAELRPIALDTLGLVPALSQLARRHQERNGTRCRFEPPAGSPPIPPAIANELFYICQESLTNVTRHAGATLVTIRLTVANQTATLEVIDDGRGIDEDVARRVDSLGLLGMRERAAQCNGTMSIQRHESGGTRVTVRIPVPDKGRIA